MVSPPKLRFHQRIQQWRQTTHLTAAHALDWEIEPRLRLVWWRAQCSALILSVQNNFTSISHWGVYVGSSNPKTLVSFGMQGPATSTQFHLWAVIDTPFETNAWAQSQAIKGFIALACQQVWREDVFPRNYPRIALAAVLHSALTPQWICICFVVETVSCSMTWAGFRREGPMPSHIVINLLLHVCLGSSSFM